MQMTQNTHENELMNDATIVKNTTVSFKSGITIRIAVTFTQHLTGYCIFDSKQKPRALKDNSVFIYGILE